MDSREEMVNVSLADLIDSMVSEAAEDAEAFVQEFGRPIESSETDWDSEAWSEWARSNRAVLDKGIVESALSEVYLGVLTIQTRWLTSGLPDMPAVAIGFADDPVLIYHRSQAGMPDRHTSPGGDWYYQPEGYDGDIFSDGHPTPLAAYRAAVQFACGEIMRAD